MPFNLGGKFGYVARETKTIELAIPPAYALAHPFHNGRAAVFQNGGWGFIDDKGVVVIPHRYDEIQGDRFYGEVAIVKKGAEWGVIDRDGKEILPITHRQVQVDEQAGRFAIARADPNAQYGGVLWGLYDFTGKQILPHEYDTLHLPFVGGIATASRGYGHTALITPDGKLLTDARYSKIVQYDYTPWWIAWDHTAKTTTAFSEHGQPKFTVPYERVGGMFEGLATFQDPATQNYGYLDENGQIAIPAQFSLAMGFREGLALVCRKVGGPVEAIDRTGRTVAGPIPGTYIRGRGFRNGLVWIGDETTKDVHCYDRQLKRVFPQSFRNAGDFDVNGLAKVDLDTHKTGLINRNGQWVIQPEWSTITPSSIPGQYIATRRDESAMFDKTGKRLTDPQPCTITPYDERFVRIGPPGWGRPGLYYCFWRADGVFFYHAEEKK